MKKSVAHIGHPSRPGETLCGCHDYPLTTCPDCLARRNSLAWVHVQSTRHPDLAFCGLSLHGSDVLSVRLGSGMDDAIRRARERGFTIVPYVTAEDAQSYIDADDAIPLHHGCVSNLSRFLMRLGGSRLLLRSSFLDDD